MMAEIKTIMNSGKHTFSVDLRRCSRSTGKLIDETMFVLPSSAVNLLLVDFKAKGDAQREPGVKRGFAHRQKSDDPHLIIIGISRDDNDDNFYERSRVQFLGE